MPTLRENAVAILSLSEREMATLAGIHDGRDDVAAKTIRAARPLVVELRDRYADDAQKPLHAEAAQEIHELGEALEKMGRDSKNEIALRDLKHESDRLHHFVSSAGGDVIITSGGWRFQKS
jgi:hypothetical protein